MAGRLQRLRETLGELAKSSADVQVIIVHDFGDQETEIELQEIVRDFNCNPGKLELKFESRAYGGPGDARNAGAKKATAEWIAFWDSDDKPHVDAFLRMVLEAETKSADISIGQFRKTKLTKSGQKKLEVTKTKSVAALGREPGLWRMAFKRKITLNSIFPSLRMGEDQVYILSVLEKCTEIYYFEELVYEYVIGNSFQLTNSLNSTLEIEKALKLVIGFNSISEVALDFKRVTEIKLLFSILRRSPRHNFFQIFKFLSVANQKIIWGIARKMCKELISKLVPVHSNPSEKLNYLLLCGGLGNQLFQLSEALSINSSPIQICIPNSQERFNLDGNLDIFDYDLSQTRVLPEPIQLGSILTPLVNLNLRISAMHRRARFLHWITALLLSVRFRKPIHLRCGEGLGFTQQHRILTNTNVFLVGYFQNEIKNEETLKVLKSLRARVRKSYENNERKKSLLVHIRLTDYLQNFEVVKAEYYERALDYSWSPDKYDLITLFSDDPESAFAIFPATYQEFLVLAENSKYSAVEILEKMRMASGFIIANSSFSWWAARLSHTPTPLVIAPVPWFGKDVTPINIYPENWLKFET